jgi:hypothetical protein
MKRRDFLRILGLSAGATAALMAIPDYVPMPAKKRSDLFGADAMRAMGDRNPERTIARLADNRITITPNEVGSQVAFTRRMPEPYTMVMHPQTYADYGFGERHDTWGVEIVTGARAPSGVSIEYDGNGIRSASEKGAVFSRDAIVHVQYGTTNTTANYDFTQVAGRLMGNAKAYESDRDLLSMLDRFGDTVGRHEATLTPGMVAGALGMIGAAKVAEEIRSPVKRSRRSLFGGKKAKG